jgi:hypothetical protein
MSSIADVRHGGCACGQVRFSTAGSPLRVGLCHCLTCRKAHGAAFNPFVVFQRDQVTLRGQLTSWRSSPAHSRDFCGVCGSRVALFSDDEAELSLGSFDDPGLFLPQYEAWTPHREPWLPPLGRPQYAENRDPADRLVGSPVDDPRSR